ncbi:TnsA-like heteromeric transposase endonuclease subunit [Micromonospora andamanensis]|nr:hypothetical protein Vwe01_61300 [Micromonospora andamanensis]
MVKYRDAAGRFHEGVLERVADEDLLGGVPVREFRWFKGRRFYSGWYWSATTGSLVAYESRLELARILLADFDSEVTAIAAQPFLLTGFDGDRQRNHVPDLLLCTVSGLVTVVDVKPRHRLDDPEVRAVFRWTERTVAARGWGFEVWSGADAVVLENVRFLAGYRRSHTVDNVLLPLALDAAHRSDTISEVEHALRSAASAVTARPVILHLLWTGVLVTDLSTPLTGCSRIWVGGEGAVR